MAARHRHVVVSPKGKPRPGTRRLQASQGLLELRRCGLCKMAGFYWSPIALKFRVLNKEAKAVIMHADTLHAFFCGAFTSDKQPFTLAASGNFDSHKCMQSISHK